MGDEASAAAVSAFCGDGRQSNHLAIEIEGDLGMRQKPCLLSNVGGYRDLAF
jgi:hypothetical protein